MRLTVIPEASARLAALRAGQVSLVDAVPPLDAGVLAQDARLKVVSGPQKLSCRLYLNGRPKDKYDSGGKDGLFADSKTRLAMTYAINRDGIIKKIFQGYAIANASPVSTVSYGYAATARASTKPPRPFGSSPISSARSATGRPWSRSTKRLPGSTSRRVAA